MIRLSGLDVKEKCMPGGIAQALPSLQVLCHSAYENATQGQTGGYMSARWLDCLPLSAAGGMFSVNLRGGLMPSFSAS